MAASYDGDGNRVFQLNYNPAAEGDLFNYICSATGRTYDLTEYEMFLRKLGVIK